MLHPSAFDFFDNIRTSPTNFADTTQVHGWPILLKSTYRTLSKNFELSHLDTIEPESLAKKKQQKTYTQK